MQYAGAQASLANFFGHKHGVGRGGVLVFCVKGVRRRGELGVSENFRFPVVHLHGLELRDSRVDVRGGNTRVARRS